MDAGAEDADPALSDVLGQIKSLELANRSLCVETMERGRELGDVKDEIHVMDEYIAKLEADLEDRRVRIAALPSVRVKKWFISLLGGDLGRNLFHRTVRRTRPAKGAPAGNGQVPHPGKTPYS
jgi:hypothetical protein